MLHLRDGHLRKKRDFTLQQVTEFCFLPAEVGFDSQEMQAELIAQRLRRDRISEGVQHGAGGLLLLDTRLLGTSTGCPFASRKHCSEASSGDGAAAGGNPST